MVALALATACATHAPTPGSTLNLAAPCLPPGISEEFFFWPVVAHRQLSLRTESGRTLEGVWSVHARAGQAVAVVWAGELLIAVDPSPETEDPDWVDSGYVMADDEGLVLRTTPGTPCSWQRNVNGVNI